MNTNETQSPGSLHPVVRQHCGSSWLGFWKRSDRGRAWHEVATAALKTHNGYVWAANILNTPESAVAMRELRKMCGWALNRARRYGFDEGQRPDMPAGQSNQLQSEMEFGREHPRASLLPNGRGERPGQEARELKP